ncbi:hypothetical protein HQ545_03580 [Candidatus Woesearchaeota archaeon]|nr:hypothetical protein [Candidatus Woesearchaeota archaeon]
MKTKNNPKGNDKTILLSVGILAVLLFSTFVLFAVTIFKKGAIIESALSLIIGVILLVALIIFLKRRYTDIKKGFPTHDERSNKVMTLAGSKAFLISVWWILIIGWASSNGWFQFRDISQATGAGILGMAVIFGLCWAYYNRKGNLE